MAVDQPVMPVGVEMVVLVLEPVPTMATSRLPGVGALVRVTDVLLELAPPCAHWTTGGAVVAVAVGVKVNVGVGV
jgi:hypothetical protein